MPDLAYALFKLLCGERTLSTDLCVQRLQCSMDELKVAYADLQRVGVDVAWCDPLLSLPSFYDCLDEGTVRGLLGDVAGGMIFAFMLSCESTNTYAVTMCKSGVWCARQRYIVACEQQTRGRGRFRRSWYTECARGLTFSYVWSPEWNYVFDDRALPLVVAFLVAQALTQLGFACPLLKWPNDILLQDGKVSGILAEKVVEPRSRAVFYVIGVGLNVYPLLGKGGEDALVSLCEKWPLATKAFPTRNHIISVVIRCLAQGMRALCEHGFGYFHAMWMAQQAWRGRSVTVTVAKRLFKGILCGVDQHGCLLVRITSGVIKSFSTGTVRLC